MLVGRQLLKSMKSKDKFVMTTPLLEDSQGRKIGKSEGNVISITDRPEDLFGKIMSLSDDVIIKAMEYLTDMDISEIQEIEKRMSEGDNPIIYKKRLAYEIVMQLNNEDDAERAQASFKNTVQDKQIPTDIEDLVINGNQLLSKILIENKLVDSNSEWKRLIEQHGVSINEIKVENPFMNTNEISDGGILKIGKRKYARIKKS
jgi:tyrosyl-tRNA synthetase